MPWTRVNNCTDGSKQGFQAGQALTADDLQAMHHDEFGRWAGWDDWLHQTQTAKQPLGIENGPPQRQN